ncbi:hypothetical protein [Sporocytophaga myxococcoides]|uniref:hypothetical protein n=1 Tax=Sporocytophaga myxococcoides TaxID=153721 RepID=UPI0004105007|nr:hypothetical protein [Sporocytophaga myxococcoides]
MNLKNHPFLSAFFGVIAIFLITGFILINFFLDSFVKSRIANEVYRSSKGLYSIEINDLNTRFWTGTVNMTKVLLYQHSTRLKTLKSEQPDTNISTVKLYIPVLRIRRIRWVNYLISKDLRVGTISIKSPEIQVKGSTVSEQFRETNKTFIEILPAIIAGFAGSLRIEEMDIESGKLKYDLETEQNKIVQTAENIFIELNDIIIDTIPRKKILYSEDIHISLGNYRLRSSDDSYTLGIDKIEGQLSDSTLQFKKFYYSKSDIINKKAKETEAVFDEIKGEQVNFRDFFYNKKIFIGKLSLESPRISTIFHQEENKQNVSIKGKSGGENKLFVSSFASDVIRSFTINDIEAHNGSIKNLIYTNQDSIFQKANNVNLRIMKVAGEIIDSIKFKNPDNIYLDFSNYELTSFNPEVKISVEKTNASSFDSTITISYLGINYKDKENKSGKIYFNNSANHISVKGFNLRAFFDEGRVKLKEIVIKDPKTDFQTVIKKETTKKKRPAFANFNKFIKALDIDRIAIENGSFSHTAITAGDSVVHKSKSYALNINGISATIDNLLPDVAQISGEFRDYELKLVKEKLILKTDLCSVSSQTSSAVLKKFRISQYKPHSQKENVFNTFIKEIRINQFDIKRTLYKSEIVAGKVLMNSMNMNVFFKEGKGLKPDYAKLMPNEMARAIPFYFRIDKVIFDNGQITFMEKKNATVLFTLNNTIASIFNLTNDPKIMTDKTPARLIGTTILQKQGKLHFNISVPLMSPKFDCKYYGRMGPMSAIAFNNVFTYTNMQAEQGQVDSASFNVGILNGVANGNLKLVYHDFKIKALDEEGETKRIKSLISNFIIKDGNPNNNKNEPEVVEVQATREPDDSVFSLLWRPLKKGIIRTVTKDTFVRN